MTRLFFLLLLCAGLAGCEPNPASWQGAKPSTFEGRLIYCRLTSHSIPWYECACLGADAKPIPCKPQE